MGCILSELLTSTPIPARCGGGVFAFNAALVQKTVDDSVNLYGCLICLPYVSALYACLMGLPYMPALYLCIETPA